MRRFQFESPMGVGTVTLDLENCEINVELERLSGGPLVGHPNKYLRVTVAAFGSIQLRFLPLASRSKTASFFTSQITEVYTETGRLCFAIQHVMPVGKTIDGFEFRWGVMFYVGTELQAMVGFGGRIKIPAGGLLAVEVSDVEVTPIVNIGGFFREI